ncbi:hypothetical protein SAY86_021187 [Trapa natans]|uniref:Uncharacterized protein n=1 Tax=Trapa natans TaxID=22666 RepID=A0AAN7M7H7_TRANT|nr:hypothetical protein SAY86_021187 [Trapa natans]
MVMAPHQPPSSSISPPPPPNLSPSNNHYHHPTPIHRPPHPKKSRLPSSTAKKRPEQSDNTPIEAGDRSVKCNKCRPHAREKITVVPIDNNGGGILCHSLPSPNVILKSIISSITKKSLSAPAPNVPTAPQEGQWKIAFAELSHQLIQAKRKREEALLDASRLKHSVADLERKLNKLEIYWQQPPPWHRGMLHGHRKLTSPTVQCRDELPKRESGGPVLRIGLGGPVCGPPYDIKIAPSQSRRTLVVYLEAILNRSFYEDFESIRFEKNHAAFVFNPAEQCETNRVCSDGLRGLTWDEVLSKGTRHFNEDFSRFFDRKMSEIVGMLGWKRTWPEPLLQAFFGASKAVWLVHLLANSVHPGLPIMRVDSGGKFDVGYMEDMGAERAR